MSQTTMGVKLDDETRDRLKALAETRRRSAHWLMKEAIGQYLEREEEIERRNREADKAWEEYQTTWAHGSIAGERTRKAHAPIPNAETGLVPRGQARPDPAAAVHRAP